MRNICYLFLTLFFLAINAYAADEAKSFALNTTGFLDDGPIPTLYTCDGKDISPAFDWVNTPDKTQTFAFILADPDAPSGIFYHWVVYNIPKSVTSIPEGGKLPSGAQAGITSWGKTEYKGPCPPKGTAHRYIFTLYALDTKLTLPAGAKAEEVIQAMQNHIIGQAKLTAAYSRWLK